MSTTVSYKGSTITTVNNETKTLNTAGTWLEDDITLVDATSGGGTIAPLSITQNGTYTASGGIDGYSPVTVNVGGSVEAEPSDVNFIDYDGTILYSYTKAQALELSALPANPSHTGLTAQGWNYTLAEMKAEVTDHGFCVVGQNYVTTDDKTRLYCRFDEGGLDPYFGVCTNGTVVVDWGDGSATTTLTGISLSTVKYTSHSYANAGNYVITITVTSGTFAFRGVSTASCVLRKSTEDVANIHRAYASSLRKIELGSTARLANYSFYYCDGLESITTPNTLSTISSYALSFCNNLKGFVIPKEVTSISGSLFRECRSLKNVSIPSRVTSIESYAFYTCTSIKNISVPKGVTTIGTSAFYQSTALKRINLLTAIKSIGSNLLRSDFCLFKVAVPSQVTSIGSYAFGYCYGVVEYHILPTTPPTLANKNAFNGIQSDCKIYVPQGCLEAYQTASNWSNYADYMVEEGA